MDFQDAWTIWSILFAICLTLALLLPMFVALARKHPNTGAITVLCVLAGCTGIGWVIAMVWACTNPNPPDYRR